MEAILSRLTPTTAKLLQLGNSNVNQNAMGLLPITHRRVSNKKWIILFFVSELLISRFDFFIICFWWFKLHAILSLMLFNHMVAMICGNIEVLLSSDYSSNFGTKLKLITKTS